MFHGPRAMVPDFFEALGFRCPERKGEADFLQEVTSRRDQAVRCASMLLADRDNFVSPGMRKPCFAAQSVSSADMSQQAS